MKPQVWRALALFVLLASNSAPAAWRVASSDRETSPNELVDGWISSVENPETNERATLHLAVFKSQSVGLRVIDQPTQPWRDLATAMAEAKALAGVNGGYFDPEDAPVGLLLSDGKVRSRLGKAKLLSAILFATGNRIDIVRASRFKLTDQMQSAVQCGPLLVERGAPVAGLNDSRTARRTFAMVDGKGRGALGVCSAVSLAQLARILCLPNVAAKFEPARALNLDGGSSSAFWFAGREKIISLPEQKAVRDFVAIIPRPTR